MSEPRAFVWDCKGTNFFLFSKLFCNLFLKKFQKKTEKIVPLSNSLINGDAKVLTFRQLPNLFFKFFGKSPKSYLDAFIACLISSIISSGSSSPMDNLIKSGDTPASLSCASES